MNPGADSEVCSKVFEMLFFRPIAKEDELKLLLLRGRLSSRSQEQVLVLHPSQPARCTHQQGRSVYAEFSSCGFTIGLALISTEIDPIGYDDDPFRPEAVIDDAIPDGLGNRDHPAGSADQQKIHLVSGTEKRGGGKIVRMHILVVSVECNHRPAAGMEKARRDTIEIAVRGVRMEQVNALGTQESSHLEHGQGIRFPPFSQNMNRKPAALRFRCKGPFLKADERELEILSLQAFHDPDDILPGPAKLSSPEQMRNTYLPHIP